MSTTGVAFTSPAQSPLVQIIKTATVGEIQPGWSIQEDATSHDILDSSGSTGNISATFRRIPQNQADQTPNAGPNPSSEYLLDQYANFWHPTLGTISGYITDCSLGTGSTDFDMATFLDALNKDVSAPAFIDGSPFYSFSLGSGFTITDLLVDANGDIWTAVNGNIVYKFNRWGKQTASVNFGSVAINKLGMDSNGDLYGLSTLAVSKYTFSTSTVSTVVNASSGSFFDFEVNAYTNMIYILTTETTAGAAVKKYNTSGTFQTSWGNYLSGTAGSAPVANFFSTLQGIGSNYFGDQIYVASGTPILVSGNYSSDIQAFSNTGTFQSISNLGINTDYNNICFEVAPTTSTAYSMYTVSSMGVNLSSFPGNNRIINNNVVMPRANTTSAPYGNLGIGADPNGSGFYIGYNNVITRYAGGKLSPYQALECYIGLGGQNRIDQVLYTNLTTSQVNVFDGGYFPAWEGNLWTAIKQLAARSRFYITTSGSKINVTSFTGTLPRIDISGHTPISKRLETATGKNLNITNWNPVSAQVSNVPLYQGGPNSSIISADYNEINTTTVQSNSYPVSIDKLVNLQGTQWSTVNTSSYMVSDSSNPPQLLSSGQFAQAGGSVTASVSDTPGSIDITMNGPKSTITGFTAPFSLAYPAGSQKVPAITVSGNGVVVNPQVIPILTGASKDVTPSDQIESIDSPFITSASFAYDTANPSCVRLGHGEMVLDFSIPLTDVHALGSIAGSIFLWERAKWRVTSAKISDGMIDITAKRFTTIFDVTPNNPTMTVGQMDTLWYGYRVQDRYISPGVVKQ